MKIHLIFCAALFATASPGVKAEAGRDDFYYDVFPEDFLWGFATAAYQVEGGWNERGENIWDRFTHRSESPIADGSTGDVACDSYHRYHEDVLALKSMGADFYRFSIAWSRILPLGADFPIHQEGIDYYNRLIEDLLANGIEPFVTLYHWDLPQPLHENGGWLNESTALHFADYARVAFQHFGDRVKNWITFNEVAVFCENGYASGHHAPGISEPAVAPYDCVHNVIKGHGLAYRIYDMEYRPVQNGRVGITLDSDWNEPADRNNASDVEASHRALKFNHGWIAYPLYHGEYPPIMRQLVDAKSEAEGREQSRLPSFNSSWTNIINGTLDFLGLNHYSSSYVFSQVNIDPGHGSDSNVGGFKDPDWPGSAAPWLHVVPWGFRRILNWLAMEYGNPPIYVMENGFADKDTDSIQDEGRVNYYRLYINEMLKAVKVDGVNVKGYTAWSLLDNFEWAEGYTQRFGIHYIDFAGGNLTRVPKDSARFLAQIIKDNGYPPASK